MSWVFEDICAWAGGLEYWEQAILNFILQKAEIGDENRKVFLTYFLEDKKLIEKRSKRPSINFSEMQDSSREQKKRYRLNQISATQNINGLVANQTILFSPELTAIYGANGSGKSGYARIFSCAGFCRGDTTILPDVQSACTNHPCVTFSLYDGKDEVVVSHTLNTKCKELEEFYSFDTTSVIVHLSTKNKFSFSPAGLEVLTRLAEETDKIRELAKEKANGFSKPQSFIYLFTGGVSAVSRLVGSLSDQTNLEEVQKLATLSEDERQRISFLTKEIGYLKHLDIPKRIREAAQYKKDLTSLKNSIDDLFAKLDDNAIGIVFEDIRALIKAEEMASQVGVDQFKSIEFKQIGSNAWQKFISAAFDIAKKEGTAERPYPQPGDKCILCHQPLGPEALVHFTKLWKFIEGEAQNTLLRAKQKVANHLKTIEAINTSCFTDETPSNRYLSDHDAELCSTVAGLVAVFTSRKGTLINCLKSKEFFPLVNTPTTCVCSIQKCIDSLQANLDALSTTDPSAEIARLEAELLELRHKQIFSDNLKDIFSYTANLQWASNVTKRLGNTRAITEKYDSLFQQVITDGYIERFNDFLNFFGRTLRVKIETKSTKGETVRRITLESNSDIKINIAPEKVLSEGEKRAVALADFLTEVSINENSCGIILDDPVTSLDLEWREKIAEVLVNESKMRQVIIFTHDLPFLYYLKKYSVANGIKLFNHWIKRGDCNNIPGYVFKNNSPALESDYKNASIVENIYKLAKDADPALQEIYLKSGFGALRTCYEAFIVFDLFNNTVKRFEERISPGNLMNIVWDWDLISEIDRRYGILSRYIEGHLHSDYYIAKPILVTLRDEIDAFNACKNKLRKLKRDAGKN